MLIPRSLVIGLTALALSACGSLSAPKQDTEQWKADWQDRTARWAEGASNGAQAMGATLSTAAHGISNGFDEPEADAFGSYPKGYAERVRGHLIRLEGVDPTARITFAMPHRGYMNQGIFQEMAVLGLDQRFVP